MRKQSILVKVCLAMVLAFIAGLLTQPETQFFGVPLVEFYGLLGQLFLNALSLLLIPLVAVSVITGAARMGAEGSFGKWGAKSFSCFFGISLLAVLIGSVVTNVMQPGVFSQEHSLLIEESVVLDQGGAFDKLVQLIYKVVPSNLFAAASEGRVLGILLFSFLFGFFIPKVDEPYRSTLLNASQGVLEVVMRITNLMMKALPIGVFGLIAKEVASGGMASIEALGAYLLSMCMAMSIYLFVALPLLLWIVARVHPFHHLRSMAPALLTAFSTSSSTASLPVLMECIGKNKGISRKISGFTLPLGASMCMSGTALYSSVSVLFIAQMVGVKLDMMTQAVIVLTSLLSSIGMAGIPAASLVSIVLILNTIGVPSENVAKIVAAERILDMCRSAVNVYGNSCCTVLIACSGKVYQEDALLYEK